MNDFFLADDLSGALDAAAAFHHAGRRVRIALSENAVQGASAGEVIAFTTETRNASPAIAAAAVERAIARGCAAGGKLRYKKIDSTLRGPVAAELSALLRSLPETRVLFCPANPAVGRTVRDGVLLVRGVPVAETEFARDPASPVRVSAIRELLGAAATERVTIADAATEEDLAAAVEMMNSGGSEWVAVGSGALARPVAREPGAAQSEKEKSPRRPVVIPSPTLFLCGSAHGMNREQAQHLAREHGVVVNEMRVDDSAPAIRATITALKNKSSAAMVLEETRTDRARALAAVTTAAAEVMAQTQVRRIFVTGGETAFALCQRLGIGVLDYVAEIEPGVALASAELAGESLLLAVKPGGFGDARTWIRAGEALR